MPVGWSLSLLLLMTSRKSREKRRNPARKLRMSEEGEEDTFNGIRAPIVGYEVVESREKFTVYKVHVRERQKSWFVFRRYTDFVRLNDKLQIAFPTFNFKLPTKRWFKNNFDPEFIEERAHGLQFFINNVMHHTTICKSDIIKEFLCLDDPPGPYDSLEESRAYCQQLEDEIEDMKEKMLELESELSATKSQLAQARVQQEALVSSLKEERASNSYRKIMAQETSTDSFKPIIDDHKSFVGQTLKDNSQETKNIASKNSWTGNLEITAHSKGVDRIKPLSRRTPETTQPLTSTPTKDSHLKLFKNENTAIDGDSCQEGVAFDKSVLEKSKETTEDFKKDNVALLSSNCESQYDDVSDEEDKEIKGNNTQQNDAPSKHSSKRDSGIILDSPSTA